MAKFSEYIVVSIVVAFLSVLTLAAGCSGGDDEETIHGEVPTTKAEQMFLLTKDFAAGSKSIQVVETAFAALGPADKKELATQKSGEQSFVSLIAATASFGSASTLLKNLLTALTPEQAIRQAMVAEMTLELRPSSQAREDAKAQVLAVRLSHTPEKANDIRDASLKFDPAAFSRAVLALSEAKDVVQKLEDQNFEAWLVWALDNRASTQAVWKQIYVHAGAKAALMRNRLLQTVFDGGDTELMGFFSALSSWGIMDGVAKDEYELKGIKGNLLFVVGKNIKLAAGSAAVPTEAVLPALADIVRGIVGLGYMGYCKELLILFGNDGRAKKLLGLDNEIKPLDVLGEANRLVPGEDLSTLEWLYHRAIINKNLATALARLEGDGQRFINGLVKLYPSLDSGIAAHWLGLLGPLSLGQLAAVGRNPVTPVVGQPPVIAPPVILTPAEAMARKVAEFKDINLDFSKVFSDDGKKQRNHDFLLLFSLRAKTPDRLDRDYNLLKNFIDFLHDPIACKNKLSNIFRNLKACQEIEMNSIVELVGSIKREFLQLSGLDPLSLNADLNIDILVAYFLGSNDPRIFEQLARLQLIEEDDAAALAVDRLLAPYLEPSYHRTAMIFVNQVFILNFRPEAS